MSPVAEFAYSAWLVSVAVDFVASIVYLVLASRRSRRSDLSASAHVRFEAIWAMVLAVPALLVVIATSLDPLSRSPWSPLLVAGLAALYVIPALALAGRSLHRVAGLYPAVIAIGSLPVAVVCGIVAGYGTFWFVFFVPIATRLGFGYAADCMVAVRFARAVRVRDEERTREQERLLLPEAPGFVFPH